VSNEHCGDIVAALALDDRPTGGVHRRTVPRPLVILLAHNEAEMHRRNRARSARSGSPKQRCSRSTIGSSDDTAAKALNAGSMVVRHRSTSVSPQARRPDSPMRSPTAFERVVRMDGDGQHDPASAAALLQALDEGNELVVGSRFLGGRSFESTGLRRAANQFLAGLLSRLCRFKVTDPTSGYRALGGRAVAFFAENFPNQYPKPESLLMASRRGFKVKEVPVVMRARRTGAARSTPLRSAFYMLKVCFALTLRAASSRSELRRLPSWPDRASWCCWLTRFLPSSSSVPRGSVG